MPTFRLRAWAEQTLYDCRDYLVEADTIEKAAERLEAAMETVEANPSARMVPGIDRILSIAEDGATLSVPDIRPLDPQEITDGASGIVEIDVEGRKLRDILPEGRSLGDTGPSL